MEGDQKKCLFCAFSCSSDSTLLKHQLKYHENDKNFRVVCLLCCSKYKSVKALRLHLANIHKKKACLTNTRQKPDSDDDPDDCIQLTKAGADDDDDVGSDGDIDMDMTFYFDEPNSAKSSTGSSTQLEEDLQKKAFSFLSDIREKCVSPQSSIDSIVKGMNDLIVSYNSVLESQLLSCQTDSLISVSQVQNYFQGLRGQSIFEGMQTSKMQKVYRRFHLTSLDPIQISTHNEATLSTSTGFKEIPVIQGYASPFLKVLETLLQNEDILHCVLNPLPSEDGQYRSLSDGYMWQSHPVLIMDPCALVFIAYGDDVQPGDGLSSKCSHQQLRSFTWTLGNIYPWLRSTLRCIMSLAILTKNKMDKGNGPALKDFIEGINKLSSEEGVIFTIKGEPRKFHGCLLFVSGDTPASANFAGMKESPSAWRPCRLCLVTSDDIFDHSTEVSDLLRNAELHQSHLAALDNGYDENAIDVNDAALPADPSVAFGVNSRSCFLDVKYFDVTKCFPLDIMHVLAENGVLEVNIRLLLKSAVQNGMNLNTINDFFKCFDYETFKKDRPGEIKQDHLNNNLRQTASQIFFLAHLIPFILKNKCGAAEMKNYIRLLMILNIGMAPCADDEDVFCLRNLIDEFLVEFKRLYGNMVLKFHFLIHLPTQILMFGCLTLQWCMRFEGFHAILKRLFKILHNSVNIPLSLMERVLSRFLNEVESCPPGTFLYQGHSGKREPGVQLKSLEWKSAIKACMPHLQDDDELIPLKNLQFHGSEFRKDSIILLNKNVTPFLPKFGSVFKEFLFQETPILLCHELVTVSFNVNLNAYQITGGRKTELVAVCLKPDQRIQPLLKVPHEGHCYVVLLNHAKVCHAALKDWTIEDASKKSKSKSSKRKR